MKAKRLITKENGEWTAEFKFSNGRVLRFFTLTGFSTFPTKEEVTHLITRSVLVATDPEDFEDKDIGFIKILKGTAEGGFFEIGALLTREGGAYKNPQKYINALK